MAKNRMRKVDIAPAIIWLILVSGVNIYFYLARTEPAFTAFNVMEKELTLKHPKQYSSEQINIISKKIASNYAVLKHGNTVTWPYDEAKRIAMKTFASHMLNFAVIPAALWIGLGYLLARRKAVNR